MPAGDARPVPRKNVAFRLYFAIRNSTNSQLITSWAGADSEVSLDGGSFADCTNEATEIGTSGCGFIDFTAAEMNADAVVYRLTLTNSNAVPLVLTLFPEEAGDYRSETTAFSGSAATAVDGKPTLAQIEASTVLAKEATVTNRPTLTQIEASTVLAKEATVTNRPTLTQIEASTVLAKEATVANRATQTSVDAKPSLAQIEASTVLAKEATVTGRPTLTQIEASTVLAKEATVATRASQTSVDGKPTLVQIEASTVLAKEATVVARPTLAQIEASSVLAKQSTLLVVAGYIDTEVADIKVVTDRLSTMLQSAGGGLWTYTTGALVNAPTGGGGGGGTDWTADERTVIRAVLGIPTSGIVPLDPSSGILDVIRDGVAALPSAATVRDTVYNAMPNAGWANGSFGDRFLVSSSAQRTVAVTGANHVAADIHELQPNVITGGDIDATALAAVAVRVADEPLAGHTTAGTLGKVLSDAGSGITTLLNRITTSVSSMFADLIQMIVNDGTASAQWSSTAMQNVPVAGGSGARSVTITVRDSGASPVQNAQVRVSRTGESFVLTTNASGVASFSLNDATWTVSITATGFSFSPVSLVVSANTTQTYTLTTAGGGVTPSTPPMSTGYWVVYDSAGAPQAGSQVTLQAAAPPVGSTGIVMEDAPRTATADANGIVQFANLVRGATYIVYRTGSSRKFNVQVPANAGTTVALGSIVG